MAVRKGAPTILELQRANRKAYAESLKRARNGGAPRGHKKTPAKLRASIPVDSTCCRLLDLSPELRNIIYEYALAPKTSKKVNITRHNFAQPALLRTCKAIRSEASSIHYLDKHFSFEIKDFNVKRLIAFYKPAAKFSNIPKPEIRVLQGSRNWKNLLMWLEAARKNPLLQYKCAEKSAHIGGGYKATMVFQFMRSIPEDIEWEKVLKLLEGFKEAVAYQGKRVWT